MSDLEITIHLPEELVGRARAASVQTENEADILIEAYEREVVRREAANLLNELAAELRALSDDEKPTPEELDAMVRQARSEVAAARRGQS
jgi:hypothetical protein